MPTVTGITAEKALEILGESVVSGEINGSGHLILTRGNATTFDAGLVTSDEPIEGTIAEYNAALTDGDFATLDGVETLTNKTLTSPTIESPVFSGVGEIQTAHKTADESVTSSTVLQDDNDLVFNVDANTTYVLRGRLFLTGHVSGSIKLAWGMPALATVSGGFGSAAGNLVDEVISDVSINQGLAAGTITHLPLEFIFTIGSNAGVVKLRWAQDSSFATATTVKDPSFIEVRTYG